MGGSASIAAASALPDADNCPLLLLVCHSADEPTLRSLLFPVQSSDDQADASTTASTYDGNGRDVVVLTEQSPRDTEARARVISAAAAALIAVGPMLQRSPALLEALSFLKDRRKRVVAGPIAFFSRPSGAAGAVCVAYGQWFDQLFSPDHPCDDATAVDTVRSELQTKFELLRVSHVSGALEIDGKDAEVIDRESENADSDVPDETSGNPTLTFISTSSSSGGGEGESDNDASRIVSALSVLESQGLTLAGIPASVSASDPLTLSLSAIRRASVIIVVITADLSDATDSIVQTYRTLVEAARRERKPLLPVKEARAGILFTDCWLSLVLAGRLWYEVDAHNLLAMHTPYSQLPNCPCRVDDACPATDLLLSVNALLAAPWRQRALEGANSDDAGTVATDDPWEKATLDAAKESAALLGLSAERAMHVLERVEVALASIQQDRENGDDNDGWRTLRDELGVPVTSTEVSKFLHDDFQQRASEWPPSSYSPAPSDDEAVARNGRIRYEVRRVGFVALPSVVDERGVFLSGSAPDVLLSYQWGSQHRVLAVHQQGHVSGLRAWLDVFGHMQGNVNAAMARAVEGVACVIVFVTAKYVSSINCRLEFQYAVQCGKPLLLAFLEDDPRSFELPKWMSDALLRGSASGTSDPLAAATVVDLRERSDGRDVDAMDALFASVRKLAALRGVQDQKWPLVSCDGSLRLFAATAALRHAAATTIGGVAGAPSIGAGGSGTAGVPCSRCGVLFRPSSEPSGGDGACRRHSAYYMGGTGGLLAGRWVCCSEAAKDGPGCIPAPHMVAARQWTRDKSYGTHTWIPDADP